MLCNIHLRMMHFMGITTFFTMAVHFSARYTFASRWVVTPPRSLTTKGDACRSLPTRAGLVNLTRSVKKLKRPTAHVYSVGCRHQRSRISTGCQTSVECREKQHGNLFDVHDQMNDLKRGSIAVPETTRWREDMSIVLRPRQLRRYQGQHLFRECDR